jgi:CxxC-x17-CxxC domain-containing protein
VNTVVEGELKTKDGRKIQISVKGAETKVSRNNRELEREQECWIGGKWLFTIFHNRSSPFEKYIGACNLGIRNQKNVKWIAQELTMDRGAREMHKSVCADCGKECEVPFRPTGDRPVYCQECWTKRSDVSYPVT